jgi:GNAT superfamily N-acetyltransferase
MDVYEELIREYWELSPPSQRYVNGINRWAHGQGHGARWIALKDGMPVGKAYLSYTVGADALAVSSEIAGIFGVYVRPSARGYGIASALTARLIEQAADLGRKLVVLHSSDMALPLYLRMGFTARCPFLVYATTELHSIQPS